MTKKHYELFGQAVELLWQSVVGKPASRDDASPTVLSALHQHTPHASTKQQYELFKQTVKLLWQSVAGEPASRNATATATEKVGFTASASLATGIATPPQDTTQAATTVLVTPIRLPVDHPGHDFD
ncbi:hypothetical protein Q7P35_005938 [Cladosporium inversicolor]